MSDPNNLPPRRSAQTCSHYRGGGQTCLAGAISEVLSKCYMGKEESIMDVLED